MWDLDPWPGMEPRTLHREWGVLATGPPGKSLCPHSRQNFPQNLRHCSIVSWWPQPASLSLELTFERVSPCDSLQHHTPAPLAFSSFFACIKFYLPTCFFFLEFSSPTLLTVGILSFIRFELKSVSSEGSSLTNLAKLANMSCAKKKKRFIQLILNDSLIGSF